MGLAPLLQFQQCSQALPDLGEHLGRRLLFEGDAPRLPIDVPHVICKDDTGERMRAGRRPRGSWPACGSKVSQTRSPASVGLMRVLVGRLLQAAKSIGSFSVA